jgi:quercetin dioxygenase-like cupin family protein
MSGPEPFVVQPGEGEAIRGPVGGPARILARSESTDGAFTAVINDVPPSQGPPEHVHTREDEMYYILEGQTRFRVGGRYFDAPAGSFMFIPRGAPHCFQNTGTNTARLLVMFTPAGMERFFEGLAALPADSPPDPDTYRAIAGAAAMEVTAPPMMPGEGAS